LTFSLEIEFRIFTGHALCEWKCSRIVEQAQLGRHFSYKIWNLDVSCEPTDT
jgi:hypothetical protein